MSMTETSPASFCNDAHGVVPPLRSDIDVVPFTDDGEELVVLYDRHGYAPEPMVLYAAVLPVVHMADGTLTAEQLAAHILGATGQSVDAAQLCTLFASIDRAGFLDSAYHRSERSRKDAEFLAHPVREPACAGSSYATDAGALRSFLDRVMATASEQSVERGAVAVVVPHIDLRVGAECYAPAYRALRDTDADVFVILGTSHYGWQDLFIPTDKDFRTPLGVVQTDRVLVQALHDALPFSLRPDDLAHRDEHSIEFQLLFLQHLFGERPFTVLPILVTSFQPFIDRGVAPAEVDRFREFIRTLRSVLSSSGKKAVFIASADMAHIGKKFGDEFAAESLLPALADEDAAVLDRAAAADAEGFFRVIAAVGDRRRICGLPPVYSMLEAVQPSRGVVLDYRQWHEQETSSAVSFASLAYYS